MSIMTETADYTIRKLSENSFLNAKLKGNIKLGIEKGVDTAKNTPFLRLEIPKYRREGATVFGTFAIVVAVSSKVTSEPFSDTREISNIFEAVENVLLEIFNDDLIKVSVDISVDRFNNIKSGVLVCEFRRYDVI